MTSNSSDVIDMIDEALRDDNLETKQGLRFMAKVMREAMRAIAASDEKIPGLIFRLGVVETSFKEFLDAQKERREKDEAERNKWRWVFVSPVAAYVVIELLKWIMRP